MAPCGRTWLCYVREISAICAKSQRYLAGSIPTAPTVITHTCIRFQTRVARQCPARTKRATAPPFDFPGARNYNHAVTTKKAGRPPSTNRRQKDSHSLHLRLSAAEHALLVGALGAERLASKILDRAIITLAPGALSLEACNLLKLCGNK